MALPEPPPDCRKHNQSGPDQPYGPGLGCFRWGGAAVEGLEVIDDYVRSSPSRISRYVDWRGQRSGAHDAEELQIARSDSDDGTVIGCPVGGTKEPVRKTGTPGVVEVNTEGKNVARSGKSSFDLFIRGGLLQFTSGHGKVDGGNAVETEKVNARAIGVGQRGPNEAVIRREVGGSVNLRQRGSGGVEVGFRAAAQVEAGRRPQRNRHRQNCNQKLGRQHHATSLRFPDSEYRFETGGKKTRFISPNRDKVILYS